MVDSAVKQRVCEKLVGNRYGRWKVSANSANISSSRNAGQVLLASLERTSWTCHRRPDRVRVLHPYPTLVGVHKLGYEDVRPVYKREPPKLRAAEWRTKRADNCDELVRRLMRLATADSPIEYRRGVRWRTGS